MTLLALAVHLVVLGRWPERAEASSAPAPRAVPTMDVRSLNVVPAAERRSDGLADTDAPFDTPGESSARGSDSVALAVKVTATSAKQKPGATFMASPSAATPDAGIGRPAAAPLEAVAEPIVVLAQGEPATAASEVAPAPELDAAASASAATDGASAVPARSSAAPAPAPIALRYPDQAVPTYRTKIPPAYSVDYEIRRGVLTGIGELSWRPDGARYEAQLKVGIAGLVLLTHTSEGGFDAAGVAPVRFTDQRTRKAARAANFQRDAGKITFSGPKDEFALPGGTQDRLSWMIQLSAILSANPKLASPGAEVVLYVSGVRADVSIWTLRYIGAETIETAAGPLRTVKFSHVPRSPKDVQSEIWLDPTRNHLPVRARLTQGDQDEGLDLVMLRVNGLP